MYQIHVSNIINVVSCSFYSLFILLAGEVIESFAIMWVHKLCLFSKAMSSGNDMVACSTFCSLFNTLRPRRNEQHFADDIFKPVFFNENVWVSIKISLKFVPKGSINNIPALVQIMAWRRLGDKPLSEPMMVSLPTHICVTRPQWVKSITLSDIRLHVPLEAQSIYCIFIYKIPTYTDWSIFSDTLLSENCLCSLEHSDRFR